MTPRTPSRRGAVLASGVLAVALLATGPATWVQASTWTALADVAVRVPGTRAAPVVAAAGVLVGAAALALAMARRWAAVLAAGVVVAGGALAMVGAVTVLADPEGVAQAGAAHDVGVGALVTDVGVTAGPWAVAALALLTAVVGIAAAVGAPRWAAGTRHDAPVPAAPRDEWDALTLGDDPTDDDGAPPAGPEARA